MTTTQDAPIPPTPEPRPFLPPPPAERLQAPQEGEAVTAPPVMTPEHATSHGRAGGAARMVWQRLRVYVHPRESSGTLPSGTAATTYTIWCRKPSSEELDNEFP